MRSRRISPWRSNFRNGARTAQHHQGSNVGFGRKADARGKSLDGASLTLSTLPLLKLKHDPRLSARRRSKPSRPSSRRSRRPRSPRRSRCSMAPSVRCRSSFALPQTTDRAAPMEPKSTAADRPRRWLSASVRGGAIAGSRYVEARDRCRSRPGGFCLRATRPWSGPRVAIRRRKELGRGSRECRRA